jgi:branched-chain amino acid transport system ATP-binding protein
VLKVTDVETGYGDVAVLHGISLEVGEGESVALLGLNGAGKSTLLQSIAGIHPVWSGDVELDGQTVTTVPSHRRLRSGMSVVAETRELFPSLTVEENLRAALATTRVGRAESRERIEQATELFPVLRERRTQLAGLLSGGQQQMLAIARALVTRPRMLLLDEPSLGLAPVLVAEIYDRLRDMRQAGIAMLIVEQHVHEVMNLCDRIYVMELGSITSSGRTSELVSDAQFARAYLGY